MIDSRLCWSANTGHRYYGKYIKALAVREHFSQLKASEQSSLTSIKPPEVSKSYTIVGVSILSHIHPGVVVARGIFDANAAQAQNDKSNKPPLPNVFDKPMSDQAMLTTVSWLKELTTKARRQPVKVEKLTGSLACVVGQKRQQKSAIIAQLKRQTD